MEGSDDVFRCHATSWCQLVSHEYVSFKLTGEMKNGSDGCQVKLTQAS